MYKINNLQKGIENRNRKRYNNLVGNFYMATTRPDTYADAPGSLCCAFHRLGALLPFAARACTLREHTAADAGAAPSNAEI